MNDLNFENKYADIGASCKYSKREKNRKINISPLKGIMGPNVE